MDASHMNQADLARVLGVNQTRVSARLRGETQWSLADIDRLAAVGVPIAVTSTAPWEARS